MVCIVLLLSSQGNVTNSIFKWFCIPARIFHKLVLSTYGTLYIFRAPENNKLAKKKKNTGPIFSTSMSKIIAH